MFFSISRSYFFEVVSFSAWFSFITCVNVCSRSEILLRHWKKIKMYQFSANMLSSKKLKIYWKSTKNLLKTGKSIEIGAWPWNRPGTKPDSNQSFSICHWNLNSMLAHNYSKISLLTAYISIHNFDMSLSNLSNIYHRY